MPYSVSENGFIRGYINGSGNVYRQIKANDYIIMTLFGTGFIGPINVGRVCKNDVLSLGSKTALALIEFIPYKANISIL